MAIATLDNIEKTFGRRVLFDKLNFTIERGERVGLIGDNGSGKTSLFKVLTGKMIVDDGQVALAKGIQMGYLAQDTAFNPQNSVMDEAELAFADLHRLSHELRDLEHEMGGHSGAELDKTLGRYQETQHEFEVAGGYAWRHRLEATLQGVGLAPITWEQNVETLSGGQRSRLALAKLLVSPTDLLLLDEPTNHLDLAAIAWLEDYLLGFSGAVLLISHDRYLLDRLANRIVWLTDCRLKSYPGNYSAFVEQRQLQELSQQRAYGEQQKDIEKQAEFIRRFSAGQRARQAMGRLKRLNRLLQSDAMVKSVKQDRKIHLSMHTDRRSGDRVLVAKGLTKSYGPRELWKDLSLEVKRGQRIGMIGPNGSGKTTLLETLLGLRDADAGEVRWGSNLQIGYYAQDQIEFDPDSTVAEEARGEREVSPQELRDMLARLLFRGDDIEKPMKLLSGGERARVAIAQLLLDQPNVLLLDEPTNHLDINSRQAVEQTLKEFNGTILCVSHDRYFLDQIASDMFILDPPNARRFEGNFTAWAKKQAAELQAAKASVREPRRSTPPKRSAPRANNPWKRPFGRLTIEEVEKQIAETETAISQCQLQFADPEIARDADRNRKLQEQYQVLTKKLKELEEEYFRRDI